VLVLKFLLQLLLLLPILGAYEWPDFRGDAAREAWRRLRPLLLGTSYYKTDQLVDRFLASMAAAGGLSILHLAQQMYGAGHQVLNASIAAPLVPRLAGAAKARDRGAFGALWRSGERKLGLFTLAVVIGLVLVGVPALEVLLGHGEFRPEQVRQLWWLLLALAGTWVGGALGQVFSAAFYATGDTHTPTRIGVDRLHPRSGPEGGGFSHVRDPRDRGGHEHLLPPERRRSPPGPGLAAGEALPLESDPSTRSRFMNVPETVELEDRPCPLGCEAGDDPVMRAGDRLHGLPGEFTVVRCRACGLMRTNPRPTIDSIGYYYPAEYGPYRTSRVGEESTGGGGWKRRLREMAEFNVERLPELEGPGRLLEIGCASGAFLHRMAREGWAVEGLEPSREAGEAARALGYPVHIGTLESAPDPREAFDLVTGWMVLEHLHQPVAALEKLWRWTRPGGWLVVSVPNAGALEFRLFRDAWFALQLPTHLYHFTPTTIRTMLQRAGWQFERIHHQRTLSNVIASTGQWVEDRAGPNALTRALRGYPENRGRKEYYLYPFASLLARFGQTGRMTVWARKPE
jgi:2-polyprenyl-3-methyl-5-hydroxy-6-metoxy-1,4-benzoquinol methylase